MTVSDTVTIAARFNGPPDSANGGYACGLVAQAIGPCAQVRLSLPPPLEVPLRRVREADGSVRLLDGDATVAEGRVARTLVDVPPSPGPAAAERAAGGYPGRHDHPFPTCFVCGPARDEDGLRLAPGPVGQDGVFACPWRPGADLAVERLVDPLFLWAALDCPSGWACMPRGSETVLATMTATIEGPVHPGRTYVVSGWRIGGEGRKHRAGSAVHDEDGVRVGFAEALWITRA